MINPVQSDISGQAASVLNSGQRTKAGSSSQFKQALNAAAVKAPESMEHIFQEASKAYQVPINLLKAVAKAESNFNPRAVSSAGAMGVMQLMPATARGLGVSDPFDARSNIFGGAKYLREGLNRYNGNVDLTLASYNAGPNNVSKYGGIPPFKETQNYVKRVKSYMGENISLDNKMVYASNSRSGASALNSQSSRYSGYGYLTGAASGMDFSNLTKLGDTLSWDYDNFKEDGEMTKEEAMYLVELMRLRMNSSGVILADGEDGLSAMIDKFQY